MAIKTVFKEKHNHLDFDIVGQELLNLPGYSSSPLFLVAIVLLANVMFCRSLFFRLSIFFWSLYFLSMASD